MFQIVRNLFSALIPLPCSFEEFLTEKSDYFDEKILREQNRSNLKYVGGKIKFKLSKNQININTELYFKNTDEIWFVQKYSDSVNKSRFNDWDTNEDLIMLSRYKTIEFDINPPA